MAWVAWSKGWIIIMAVCVSCMPHLACCSFTNPSMDAKQTDRLTDSLAHTRTLPKPTNHPSQQAGGDAGGAQAPCAPP